MDIAQTFVIIIAELVSMSSNIVGAQKGLLVQDVIFRTLKFGPVEHSLEFYFLSKHMYLNFFLCCPSICFFKDAFVLKLWPVQGSLSHIIWV